MNSPSWTLEKQLTCGPRRAGSGTRTHGNGSSNTWQPLNPKHDGSESRSSVAGHPRLFEPVQDRVYGWNQRILCLQLMIIWISFGHLDNWLIFQFLWLIIFNSKSSQCCFLCLTEVWTWNPMCWTAVKSNSSVIRLCLINFFDFYSFNVDIPVLYT